MKLRSIPPELRGELASLAPLPETAGELKAIAQIYGESNSLLLLNQNATHQRGSTPSHRRSDHRVATHGLMAGELKHLREPAIVLTAATAAPSMDC